MRVYMFKYL